ncbi:hypothetical protein DSCO28_50660 [Desulfosarcina ovata subsp. sediminis]|uniref:Uncharacterized protein n=1 Tax=Desulfosarcina ovata subsp. sediminis TaxID=885957 RepID=A0A5K7ZWL7_9BACT|nr:hypothetical protein DSCO28_50660 [Desulfosarcina ovata subsp. sediminis]
MKQWPTPHGFSQDGKSNGPSGNELGRAVNRSIPTPTSSMMTMADMEQAKYSGNGGKRPSYKDAKFPTPAARDYRSPNKKPYSERGGGKKGEQLPNAVGGSLNPPWVEWLMGWPIGWTDLEPLETAKFRSWLQQHSAFCNQKLGE